MSFLTCHLSCARSSQVAYELSMIEGNHGMDASEVLLPSGGDAHLGAHLEEVLERKGTE